MRRIYEVEFEHNKCFMDERFKRNKTYAIFPRFFTEPLFRNLCEINLGDSIYLADIIDVNITGIIFVLRVGCFLMYRKVNPYA